MIMRISRNHGALGLPSARLDDVVDDSQHGLIDIAVLGLPFDGGVTGLPGQRHGPEILRSLGPVYDWSPGLDLTLSGIYDPYVKDIVLEDMRVADLGDLGSVPIDLRVTRKQYYVQTRAHALGLFRSGIIPVFIGGDHSLTAPLVEAAQRTFGLIDLVVLDAHFDYEDSLTVDHTNLTHANFLNFLLSRKCLSTAEVLGVRTLLERFLEPPTVLKMHRTPDELSRKGKESYTYLSLDLDVLDPSEFPATGHPEPAGWRLTELEDAVRCIVGNRRVVGIDIVEAVPEDPNNQRTASVMARVLQTCLISLAQALRPERTRK